MRNWSAAELTKLADRMLAECFENGEAPHVTNLARTARISSANFSDLFLRMVNMRPLEYLRRGQIKRAQYLLRTTRLPVEEIAYLCCFNNAVTFFRAFKRITSTTPAQFRKESEKM